MLNLDVFNLPMKDPKELRGLIDKNRGRFFIGVVFQRGAPPRPSVPLSRPCPSPVLFPRVSAPFGALARSWPRSRGCSAPRPPRPRRSRPPRVGVWGAISGEGPVSRKKITGCSSGSDAPLFSDLAVFLVVLCLLIGDTARLLYRVATLLGVYCDRFETYFLGGVQHSGCICRHRCVSDF